MSPNFREDALWSGIWLPVFSGQHTKFVISSEQEVFEMSYPTCLCNKTDTVLRDIEARSCSHCCSGKAVSFTYNAEAFVALRIQHAMRVRHLFIRGLPRSTIFFHKEHDPRCGYWNIRVKEQLCLGIAIIIQLYLQLYITYRLHFDVLLTVHLSIFISVINQLHAQNFCLKISLFHASTPIGVMIPEAV